jgi:hypothetical protein
MNVDAYWYFVDGHLKRHMIPPVDPSTITFVMIRLTDIGYKKVRAEIIPCIEGKYLPSEFFTSNPYESPKNFGDRMENEIKKFLTEQRRITDWTKARKIKHGKKLPKRCKK